MTNQPDLASAIAMLAQSTTQNTQLLQQLVDKIDKVVVSNEKISEDELKAQNPLKAITKYYLQKLIVINGQETWENDGKEFFHKSSAEEYGLKTYGHSKFRILTKAFYISKKDNDDNINNTSTAGEMIND